MVQLVGESTGFGSDTVKWEKWCNYVFNAGYIMDKDQIKELAETLYLHAGHAFDKLKHIVCTVVMLLICKAILLPVLDSNSESRVSRV